MPDSSRQREVAIVGAACRLPGTENTSAFRRLLFEGRCAVVPAPTGRWSIERFLHPRGTEPGFSYSFAGGYLEEPFAFDPTVFGISPREAVQIDPQQRLLLELVWEALEDARLPASSLAGHEVGVYVGTSSLDHGNLHASDPSSIDSYFMTGNTLSVVSNRISYIFDWHGPSFTIDTACSSSMVALAQAMSDLRSGRVDTAVVGGVNMLLTPISYVGFSRASMLSPTGLCRPFSAAADGYVRAEGGVALVLRREDEVVPGSARAWCVASRVNSDGRTSGIALPGLAGQISLLEGLYGESGLSPDDIAFVEAHGTGTRVGDPIEATAIGRVVATGRCRPLPIGSVKSNIGHLEPASGVAGVLKAIIALEARRLPATLHIDEFNPHVDFGELNLAPACESVALDTAAEALHCGVSSFGFGGTNAHVILRSAANSPTQVAPEGAIARHLVLSAATKEALRALGGEYAARLRDEVIDPICLATAVAEGRDQLSHRAVVTLEESTDLAAVLADYAETGVSDAVVEGTAVAKTPEVCFVYSGNGSQWVGMGRTAHGLNPNFRARFDAIDAVFRKRDGRSLREDLFDENFATEMAQASFVQPLIYAVQSAITAALMAEGLVPDVVVGHSIGELAACEAAGILDTEGVTQIIQARAACQETVRGQGLMAVFAASRERIEEFLGELGRDDIEIAAENGPNSITVTGTKDAVKTAVGVGRRKRLAARILDIEYPFHSQYLDDQHDRLIAMIGTLSPRPATVPMISTVTGEAVGERALDAAYWWENFRKPVRFGRAVEVAGEAGANLFVEIGARPILLSPIADVLKTAKVAARVLPTLNESDDRKPTRDPIARIIADAIANGAVLRGICAGRTAVVDRSIDLPSYPWQHQTFHFEHTSERLDLYGDLPRHPLIGSRLAQGMPEWRTLIDPVVVPYLADHKVDDEIIVPAAAYVEMLLAVGRELRPEGALGIEDLDILQPLVLRGDSMRELSIRLAETTGVVEVWSRQRLGADEWSLHARGRLIPVTGTTHDLPRLAEALFTADAGSIYDRASATGIDYGPGFRLATGMRRDKSIMEVALEPARDLTGHFTHRQVLHPASLDAAFHPLFELLEIDPKKKRAYLPVRYGRVTVHRDQAKIVSATLRVERETDYSLTVSIVLREADGGIVATIDHALLRSVVMSIRDDDDALFHVVFEPETRLTTDGSVLAACIAAAEEDRGEELPAGQLLLRALMRSTGHRALMRLTDAGRRFDISELTLTGRLAEGAHSYLAVLAGELVAAGLAEADGDGWRLAEDSDLPESDPILSTFAAECPSASAELVLAALAVTSIDEHLATGRPLKPNATVLQQYIASALFMVPAVARAERLLDVMIARADRPRVLLAETCCRALLPRLLHAVRRQEIELTVASLDSSRLEKLAAQVPAGAEIHWLDLSASGGETPPDQDFVVVQAQCLGAGDEPLLAGLAGRLVEGAVALVVQPANDPVVDFLLGQTADWFEASLDPLLPIGRVPTVEETRARLTRAGFRDVSAHAGLDGAGHLILARGAARAVPSRPRGAVVVIAREADELALRLTSATAVSVTGEEKIRPERICLPMISGTDDLERTTEALCHLTEAITTASAASDGSRLWIVVRGAFGATVDPVAEAVWDFGRVALNEYAALDIHLIDIDPRLSVEAALERLLARIAEPGNEREIHLGTEGTTLARVRRRLPWAPNTPHDVEAMELHFPRRGALEHFAWQPKARRRPAPGEVEVEVLGTGLNFRDVMLAMGLLDDDILDDGMAGAVLGFECGGRVVAVGDGVSELSVGDEVFGFVANAFATHVTAPRSAFSRVPAGIGAEAAATIPVTFVTAWYGLVELARLKKGERVLVHGAAGGVGLAAIQIAKARGAVVIATVSTPEKQALVKLFGADHVYNSRTLAFADEIRDRFGGVDVVLNSLAGEAMKASLKCLRPFGRFVELGKRDYVGNTEIGLRPFRRNLTYFGVDVDQLIVHDPALVTEILEKLAAGFAEETYTALPYRVFSSEEIGAAFRLMQSAGHVGKIVVRPPSAGDADARDPELAPFVPGDGVQLVVGGTGGFGLATAEWLAAKGATQIVVASRRGKLEDEADERVAALRASDVSFTVETVDATSAASVDALVARVARALGPITGVYLTAMVLDDGLISNLTRERIEKVLAPKIAGATHLDRATRAQPIRQFVMFSSATTLIGSAGQASYVAANGYLQGLARRRRVEGLPALAVGWGAIADVGVLSRDRVTAEKLERVTGVIGLKATEALGQLDRMIAASELLADSVAFCMRFQRVGAMKDLPILTTPTFRQMFGPGDDADDGVETDLATLVASKTDDEALKILDDVIVKEVARILRLSAKEIDLERPLTELGLDSLMALELRMSVESRFGVELPLVAITSVKNLGELSRRMLRTLRAGDDTESEGSIDKGDLALIAMHGGDEEAFAGLAARIEVKKQESAR